LRIKVEKTLVYAISLLILETRMDRKPLLQHTHIVKLGRLLDMMYRPSEVAEEIEINVDTIYRSYLPAGLPHTRDSSGQIWIYGPAFVAWAKETISKKKTQRVGLPNDHAWCMKCNQPVLLIDPKIKVINRYLQFLQSYCPHCNTKVNRACKREVPQ
jgi:hypothetical protein